MAKRVSDVELKQLVRYIIDNNAVNAFREIFAEITYKATVLSKMIPNINWNHRTTREIEEAYARLMPKSKL